MKFIFQLLGMALMLFGVYFLGRNIIFTTNVSPYFWRGISADISVFALTSGVVGLFMLPRSQKFLGWILIIIGVVFVVFSSRAILNSTSLWEFFLSFISMIGGFKLLTDKKFGG